MSSNGLLCRYGYKDPISEEWTPGVFASIWQRYNNRTWEQISLT